MALVEVVPGPVFFGWVIGLSQEMRLTGPEELVEQCRAVAQRSLCPWDLETGGRKSSPEPEQSEKDSSPGAARSVQGPFFRAGTFLGTGTFAGTGMHGESACPGTGRPA